MITLSFSLRGIEGDMAQSLSNVLIHTVFSTKDRGPHIIPALQPEMHAYLAKICQSLGCFVFKIGGWKITCIFLRLFQERLPKAHSLKRSKPVPQNGLRANTLILKYFPGKEALAFSLFVPHILTL